MRNICIAIAAFCMMILILFGILVLIGVSAESQTILDGIRIALELVN